MPLIVVILLLTGTACGSTAPHEEQSSATETTPPRSEASSEADQTVLLVAGDPAYRVTTTGPHEPEWDVWRIGRGGATEWMAHMPAFFTVEPMRLDGTVYLVGSVCDDEQCTSGTPAALELAPDPVVIDLPLEGAVNEQATLSVHQVGADEGQIVASVISFSASGPIDQLVRFTPGGEWEVLVDRGKEHPPRGGLWCASGGGYVGVAMVVDDPNAPETEWVVSEVVEGTERELDRFEVPSRGSRTVCLDGEVVWGTATSPQAFGRWVPETGFVGEHESFAPENTQVTWLDAGAMWIDERGHLMAWQGGAPIDAGALPMTEDEIRDHATRQSDPLGTHPAIWTLVGDIHDGHIIGCAGPPEGTGAERCVTS